MSAEKIERQAAAWLAAQDAGALSPEHDSALQQWLAQDDRHRAALIRLQACWTRADRFERLRGTGNEVDINLLESQDCSPRARKRWWFGSVAAAVVLAALGVRLATDLGAQHYRTPIDGLARVLLPDGSVVELNTATEIRVHFTARERRVRLLHGEAQFTVAHEARPFDVEVGPRTVRAVGTVFDVRREGEDEVRVIVTAGRVAILPTVTLAEIPVTAIPSDFPTVKAGEAAEVGQHQLIRVRSLGSSVEHAVEWTHGRLWFDRATLSEAIAQFNRYNARQFVVDDPSLADVHIGGAFEIADVESFAAALRSFGVQIDESDPKLLRLSKAP